METITVRTAGDVKVLIRSNVPEVKLEELDKLIKNCSDYSVEISEYGVIFSFKR